MIKIRLSPEIIDYADNVAAARQGQAFVKQRENKNGFVGSFERMFAAHRLGARCEAAGKLFLNPIRWHALSEKITRLPDLGTFIDVKGRGKATHQLIVQKDDEDDFAFLLVSAEDHPDYHIIGWMWGRDAKQTQFWADPAGGRPAFFVPRERLSCPTTLLDLVQGVKSKNGASN